MTEKPTRTDLDRRRLLRAIGVTAGASVTSFSATGAVAAAEPTQKNTVAYDELSAEARRIFDDALAERVHSATSLFPPELRYNDYVRYDGDTYALDFRQPQVTKHALRPKPLDRMPPTEADVRCYSDLSEAAKEMIDAALDDGLYVTNGNRPPGEFSLDDVYLKYDGEYYLLNFVVMNVPKNAVAFK